MERKNSLFSKGNSKIPRDAENISFCCLEDDTDDFSFTEGEPKFGKSIATFSFGANNVPSAASPPAAAQSLLQTFSDYPIDKNKPASATPKGITPPIDGEHFTLKRGYQLRPSTLRKLNELKSLHPDVNVYLNTILDAAILHYYNYITKENGQFTS